ncbi:MAG: HD-GYP domain-containing protein [Lachnospiraceae bacterium]|nr:HD-GYP domain-containing protein [Lachnospiraceae bacterium]
MKTQIIPTEEAIPGMIVAEDIFGLQDYLIIPANSELTNHSITRLKFYAIKQISIVLNEEGEPEQLTYGDLSAETYSEYIKNTPEFQKFHKEYSNVVEDFKKKIQIINNRLKDPLDSSDLSEQMENILLESRNNIHVIHMLQCLQDSNDETYHHSISVAIMCNVMGHWMHYSEEDIKVLTLAGMLHDIGKITVPSAIIYKNSRLTKVEYEIVKNHVKEGYKLLLDQDLDDRILNAALMHHERLDGSGYPNGLKGSEIDEFAQIVAVADVYIAMTNPRAYRRANCPFDAISVLIQDGYDKFSAKVLLPFFEGMAQSYLNATVKLSSDEVGEIIFIDANNITRPVVKVGHNFVDLNKNRNLHIQEVL